jgi:Family of unknown function (DUF6998)
VTHMDHALFRKLIHDLYATVAALEEMFPGRHFTPDGHMVGSIGECLVADAYDLELMPASNQGYDAVAKDGRKVEIKATQGDRVLFRSCPEHVIAIRILPDGTFEECFNGPGDVIWHEFAGKPMPSNGQYGIGLSRVRQLSESVPASRRVVRNEDSGN